jgi:MinD-like ATPase involved in chromosome partitioning or flagellar assembly
MSTIVSVHSYRGGTGKSNFIANLASCVVKQGKRAAVVDTEIQSPGLHVLFGMDGQTTGLTLNDVLILRPDQQDFQGTAVTVEVARKLKVKRLLLVVNKVLPKLDVASLRQQVQVAYDAPVAGLFPVAEEMIELGSAGIFSLVYPHHPYSQGARELTSQAVNPA